MRAFAYARPQSLPEAFALLDQHGPDACALAGGTDLIVALRNRSLRPKVVVDLKRVRELRPAIDQEDGVVRIGANAVMADLEHDARIRTLFPALGEAMAVVGSIQIRHRATLTGNICHASPAADTAPALLVYGAAVNVASMRGNRRVPLEHFFVGPGKTVLQPGELATSIELPLPPARRGAAFARVTRRRGVDLATINLCCLVESTGRTTFAYGAVGPTPFAVTDESGLLAAPGGDADAMDELLAQMLTRASPISDVRGSREYRTAMLRVMSRRALATAIERLRAA